jgi:hypothetical protein
MSNNENRASRFDEVVANYGDDSPDTNLTDMLADAMLWADHTGRDFHIAFAQACRHYIDELNDQPQDERRLIP